MIARTCEVKRGAILCRLCGRISRNPSDVAHRYCGSCHMFHDVVAQARADVAKGAGHDCGEWKIYAIAGVGECVLCGRKFEDEAASR